MDAQPNIEYHTSEDDVRNRTYLKLEYPHLLEMNISQEEWCELYEEFKTLDDNYKIDIMKYIYLNFAMADMLNLKNKKGGDEK